MKRAQTATIDFIVAIGLMSVVLVIASSTFLSTTQPPALETQAQTLAGTIFTAYPTNWTTETVVSPGFVVDHRLDEELFTQFQLLENVPAVTEKYFVNTTLGWAGDRPDGARNVYQITRYAAYKGNVTPVEVIVWQE